MSQLAESPPEDLPPSPPELPLPPVGNGWRDLVVEEAGVDIVTLQAFIENGELARITMTVISMLSLNGLAIAVMAWLPRLSGHVWLLSLSNMVRARGDDAARMQR